MPSKKKKTNFIQLPLVGGQSLEVLAGAKFKIESGGKYDPGDKINALDKKADFLLLLMSGVVVVLLAGFASLIFTLAGILTDTWRENVNSYIDYENSAEKSAENFQSLDGELQEINKKLNLIETRFNDLESKMPTSKVSLENGS